MKKLDVVIPHLNYPDFQVGIDTLRRNTPEGVLNKIIFINQNDAHLVKNVDIEVKSHNLGFAKAMNTGLRLSDAPFVMLLNDDVVFLNKQWWKGIEDTFNEYSTALCVNPASICDPDGAGGRNIMEGFSYKEDYSDEEYQQLLTAKGTGVIDGICFWGPVFNREKLDSLKGIVPGKAWLNEAFRYGGGEDYYMNRMAYQQGMRCLGTNSSVVWHWWHGTQIKTTDKDGPHFDNTFYELCGLWENGIMIEAPDVYGAKGIKNHQVIVRDE